MTFLAVTTDTWIVTCLGFCMVLVLLFVFVYIMKGLGLIMGGGCKKKEAAPSGKKASAPSTPNDAAAVATALHLSQEDADMAAVAMALHLYYGVHDMEAPKMTLVGRASAWNDKSFGINNISK